MLETSCQFDPEWDVSGVMKSNGRTTGVYLVLRHYEVEADVDRSLQYILGLSRMCNNRLEVERRYKCLVVNIFYRVLYRVVERDPIMNRNSRGRGGRGGGRGTAGGSGRGIGRGGRGMKGGR